MIGVHKELKELKGIKKIHFVGIGGAGMSPLAKMMVELGYEVSGSDREDSGIIEKLRQMGETAPIEDSVAIRRGAILGALSLYLDFINLFLMLLRLFGNRD